MEENHLKAIYECAKLGNWNYLKTIIENHATSFSDISKPNEDDFNRNLLHYACGIEDHSETEAAVKMIFEQMRSLGYFPSEWYNFVNSTNSSNRTPLDIVIGRGLDEVIKILLENDAQIKIKFDSTFNQKYQDVLVSVLDKQIILEQDLWDSSDESLWTISCDFSMITGKSGNSKAIQVSDNESENSNSTLEDEVNSINANDIQDTVSEENLAETQVFAQILNLPREKRFNLLMHPLVQLFVYNKCKKFEIATTVSIVFHIFWYMTNAIAITRTMTGVSAANSATANATINNDTVVNERATKQVEIYDTGFQVSFQIVLGVLFAVMISKELVELLLCPSKKYHFKQMEKLGQYAVIVVIVIIAINESVGGSVHNFDEWVQILLSIVYSLGFIASLLLIQGQFSKTVMFGVTNHMIMKGFKRLLWFILPFIPMFVAFGIFFQALLPNDTSFSLIVLFPKTLSMQTGEVNFDDVFSKENLQRNYFFSVPAAIILTVFIIVMVILFPILLTGLTVDSITELKDESIAAHAASRLEVANILESFWLGIQNTYLSMKSRFKCVKKQPNSNDIPMSEVVAGPSNNTSAQNTVSRRVVENKLKRSLPSKNEGLPDTFTYTVWFEDIPDDIKGLIFKNLSKYLISNTNNS